MHQPLMIVCHCHGVTDREIRSCVKNGARNCSDVGDACGAATGCGGCSTLVAEIVQEAATQIDTQRRLVVVGQGAVAAALSLGICGEPAAAF